MPIEQQTIEDVCEYDEYIRDDEYTFKTGDMCIGGVLYPNENGEFLLDIAIDPKLFYKFDYSLINEFLQIPIHPEHKLFGELEIIQIQIVDEAYTVVLKTVWIRIIQRAWKRLMRERKEWIQKIKKNVLGFVCRRTIIPQEPSCRGLLCRGTYGSPY